MNGAPMKPQRERFWGLYNWKFEEWISCEGKRKRFTSADAAGAHASDCMYGRHIGPRPFYVVRKPRALPPFVTRELSAIDSNVSRLKDLVQPGNRLDIVHKFIDAISGSVEEIRRQCGISSSS